MSVERHAESATRTVTRSRFSIGRARRSRAEAVDPSAEPAWGSALAVGAAAEPAWGSALQKSRASLPYLPGIDALRALAVLAVLLYHAEVSWMPGGFLGVDVFFVISGYLITSLLLTERKQTGTIDLKRFWKRRARRLLPAAFVMLGITLAGAVLFLHDEVAGLRGAAVASFGYVTNWFLIFSKQSYFESFGRPSLFRHLWSLAVEEQFYLMWPIAFAVGMKFVGRRGLLWGVLAGIVASTAWMWILFEPGRDPSRVYYGTDTRLAGLLCGVALALVWNPRRLRPQVGRFAPLLLDGVGTIALVLLIRQLVVMSEFDTALYHGGFLRLSILTAIVLAVTAHPAARLGRILGGSVGGFRPLVWVGVRSYSIYLWHWPVFMLTRPGQDVDLEGLPLLTLRLVLSLALGALSYRFVEDPIRHGAWTRWRASLRAARRAGAPQFQRFVFAGVASTAVVFLLAGAVMAADKPAEPALVLASRGGTPVVATLRTTTTPAPTTTTTVATTPTTAASAGHATTTPSATAAPTTTVAPAPYPPTLAIGDSVMLGASDALAAQFQGSITVDAVVARPFDDGVWAARYYRDEVGLPDVVIVHLGNNGYFTGEQFDTLMDVLRDVPRVIFVTTKVTQRWQDEVNSTLVAGAQRWPNVRVADWKGISQDHPEYFYEDLTHLTSTGASVYAQFLAAQVRP
jgi:peptidoglycan/LPS O-acetylase OafA/YrhL